MPILNMYAPVRVFHKQDDVGIFATHSWTSLWCLCYSVLTLVINHWFYLLLASAHHQHKYSGQLTKQYPACNTCNRNPVSNVHFIFCYQRRNSFRCWRDCCDWFALFILKPKFNSQWKYRPSTTLWYSYKVSWKLAEVFTDKISNAKVSENENMSYWHPIDIAILLISEGFLPPAEHCMSLCYDWVNRVS